MKVLHIISSGGMYGAEAVILNLSRLLNERHHASTLGIFANAPRPNLELHEAAIREGIQSELIPCTGQIDRGVLPAIRALAKKTGADIIHAHGYKADIYTHLALRSSSIPLVSTCHNWLDTNALVRLYGIADRLVLRSYNAVIAVSEAVRQTLLQSGVEGSKIHLIRNGIDLRPFTDAPASLRDTLPTETLAVGLTGRLSPEKGVDIFVRAAHRVLAELPSTRFLIIGDGPERSAVEALVRQLNVESSVTLLGRREDMPSVYASLDLLVSSSRTEGLPMGLLEGMASSLPVVATDVGDVPRLIHNGITGTLVPAEDPSAIAAAIIHLLNDPAKRQQLGREARKLVEDNFSANRMAADYLSVYQTATSTKQNTANY